MLETFTLPPAVEMAGNVERIPAEEVPCLQTQCKGTGDTATRQPFDKHACDVEKFLKHFALNSESLNYECDQRKIMQAHQ